MSIDRRKFLRGSAGAALALGLPDDLIAQAATATAPASSWDAGGVRHLLPAVSDTRMLIKASFDAPMADAPTLMSAAHPCAAAWATRAASIGTSMPPTSHRAARTAVAHRGARRAAMRAVGAFDLSGPRRAAGAVPFADLHLRGRPRGPQIPPRRDAQSVAAARAEFAPQAVVANGDQVYWDLLAPVGSRLLGMHPTPCELAGMFDRSALVLGGDNEAVLKRAAGPQIVPVYGTDFRSTPVFFMQDDHDYFDNDEATDEIVTFPPSYFMLPARARDAEHVLSGIPARRGAAARPAMVVGRRPGVGRFGKLRHAALRPPRRGAALRRAPHADAGRAERGLRRSAGREMAEGAHAPRPR